MKHVNCKHELTLRERRTYSAQTLAQKLAERYVCEPNSGCWLWTGRLNADGYGLVYCGNQSQALATRTMYEITHGILLPSDLCVCHRCDTPQCVNPNHFFLGTSAANVRDAAAKGRTHRWRGQRAGEKNHSAKLTQAIVDDIRQSYPAISQRALARHHGVSKTTIQYVLRGWSWSPEWRERREQRVLTLYRVERDQ